MAKTPKKPTKKVTKKKPCKCPEQALMSTIDPLTETVSATVTIPVTTPCSPCNSVETGVWGLVWRNAAGECVCLPFSGTGAKYLKGDENGPYWANS